jgi:signal transduction histidine kinase
VRLLQRLASRPFERRLILSYLGAFAVVIIVFAIAVRLSFDSIIEQQTTARLATLARAGTAAIELTPAGYTVDARSLGAFVVHTATEGLQWFDVNKRLRATRGRAPQRFVPPAIGRGQLTTESGALDTYTVVIADARNKVLGYVRAGETIDEEQRGRAALDLGLAFGSIVAIVAATIGGSALASEALAQREESYERLREFTADASHELRTPLAALATTAGLALREAPDLPQPTYRRLVAIVSLTDQMNRLVDDLLILARAGRSLEREMFVVPVDALLDRVSGAQAPLAAKKSLDFQVHRCQPIQVVGNPDQLERIVTNIVENAIRYTAPGGFVDVSCANDHANIRIIVRDTGIGIPSEFRERIFDRFWRGDYARTGDGGTGLGLAIARALARRHGGDIAVASEIGRGSTFTLTLPLRPPSLA